MAGGAFVPVNPLLKPQQVAHILADSGARVLVTSAARLDLLSEVLAQCAALEHVVVVDEPGTAPDGVAVHGWAVLMRDATVDTAARRVSTSTSPPSSTRPAARACPRASS